MAINRLEIAITQGGHYTYCPNPSGYIQAVDLWPNSGQAITTPTGADVVLFSCVDSAANPTGFWFKSGAIAVIPTSGGVSDGSASVANPGGRCISGVNTLGFISPVACKVVCEFYKIKA